MKTLILDATTKSITAVMSGAAATTNPDFTMAYADVTMTTFTEGANDGALNGATPVTIVAAPAASTRRVVKSITIQNRDTAPVIITLRYVSAGGTRQIWKGTLAVNDTWTPDGVLDGNGNLKTIAGQSVHYDSVAPGVGDDVNDGYLIGSAWIDTTADCAYICVDNAVGAAVWHKVSGGIVTTSHTHAKLVAFDGSPDPALSADASGNITGVAALTGTQVNTVRDSAIKILDAKSVGYIDNEIVPLFSIDIPATAMITAEIGLSTHRILTGTYGGYKKYRVRIYRDSAGTQQVNSTVELTDAASNEQIVTDALTNAVVTNTYTFSIQRDHTATPGVRLTVDINLFGYACANFTWLI